MCQFFSFSLSPSLFADKCGVCEGNNDTCEELTGNVYVSDLLKQKKPASSLYYVTTIPKGVYACQVPRLIQPSNDPSIHTLSRIAERFHNLIWLMI